MFEDKLEGSEMWLAVAPVIDLNAGDKQQQDLVPQDLVPIDNVLSNSVLSDWDQPENGLNPFYTDGQVHHKKNSRVATRFIRDDISGFIKVSGFFGFRKIFAVDVMDISSKGALISTHQKLGVNKRITLTFQFKSGVIFEIKAIVVRHSGVPRNEYGINFDRYNNEFGDYLFESQEKLMFK